MKEIKECIFCGKQTPRNRNVFCSDECAKKQKEIYIKEYQIVQTHKKVLEIIRETMCLKELVGITGKEYRIFFTNLVEKRRWKIRWLDKKYARNN